MNKGEPIPDEVLDALMILAFAEQPCKCGHPKKKHNSGQEMCFADMENSRICGCTEFEPVDESKGSSR